MSKKEKKKKKKKKKRTSIFSFFFGYPFVCFQRSEVPYAISGIPGFYLLRFSGSDAAALNGRNPAFLKISSPVFSFVD